MKIVDKMLALALLAAPCFAHAQDGAQTVENAQKFLSIVLPGNGYMAGWMDTGLRETLQGMREQGVRSTGGEIQGKAIIVDAAAVTHCRSKLLSDYSDVKLKVWGRNGTGPMENGTKTASELTNWFPKSAGGVTRFGTQEGFPWSNVKSVRTAGGDVYIMFAGNENASTIYLNSEDLASRVAHAVDFLRISCDAAAGTGF